jgi:hypothetical protein
LLASRIEAFDAARTRVPLNLTTLSEAVRELRDSLSAALQASFPGPLKEGDAATPAGLAEGRFRQALNDVLAKRASGRERLLGTEELMPAEAPGMGGVVEAAAVEPTVPAILAITIEAPQRPTVGEPVFLRVIPMTRGGSPIPALTVRWEVTGEPAVQGLPGDLTYRFTPRRAGPVLIHAAAVAPEMGDAVAEITLHIRSEEGYAALPGLHEQLRRAEFLQTIVSGVLIAATGFVIFKGTFIGTVEDFLAAILWGFTVDIDVAKVREIATPLLGRTVQFPPQKP